VKWQLPMFKPNTVNIEDFVVLYPEREYMAP
jgi:hypothetical protein